MAITLTIGILTYNRKAKLERLLGSLGAHLAGPGLEGRVQVLISDNASSDGTDEMVARFQRANPALPLTYNRHLENVGAVRNVDWLYNHFQGDYLWLFADDDILMPGAVGTVYSALSEHLPQVLLFSFIQPPGSTKRVYDFPEPVRIVEESETVARLVAKGAKISNIVYQRLELTLESKDFLREILEQKKGGYYQSIIAVSVLASVERGRLAVISLPLATCDEDFRVLRTPVTDWAQHRHIFQHPRLLREVPQLAIEFSPRSAYIEELTVLWAWRSGNLEVDSDFLPQYDQAVRALPLRIDWLIEDPAMLARAMALCFLPSPVPKLLHRVARLLRGRSVSSL